MQIEMSIGILELRVDQIDLESCLFLNFAQIINLLCLFYMFCLGIIPSFTIELPPGWCPGEEENQFDEKEENIVPIAKQLYDASVGLASELLKDSFTVIG